MGYHNQWVNTFFIYQKTNIIEIYIHDYIQTSSWWLRAKLWKLQNIGNGVTTVLRKTVEILVNKVTWHMKKYCWLHDAFANNSLTHWCLGDVEVNLQVFFNQWWSNTTGMAIPADALTHCAAKASAATKNKDRVSQACFSFPGRYISTILTHYGLMTPYGYTDLG